MSISPQSIRKGVTIKFDGIIVDKPTILEVSKEWSLNQENMFKKLLKQGGEFSIKEIKISVQPVEKIFNSKLESEIKVPPCDPLGRF